MSNSPRGRIQANSSSRRLPPFEAAEALFNIQPYLDLSGKVYVHLKPDDETMAAIPTMPANEEVDYLSLKIGRTGDLERRRGEYEHTCVGEEICWAFYYETSKVKLVGAFRVSVPEESALTHNRTSWATFSGGERGETGSASLQRMPRETLRVQRGDGGRRAGRGGGSA